MPKTSPVHSVELAFKEGKPIDDAVKKAAKLAKKAHEARGRELPASRGKLGVKEASKSAR